MYDAGKIITGLIIFIGLVTYSIWGSIGEEVHKPKPVIISGENCVESADYMRANHMQLLDDWRQSVVRNNDRVYVSSMDGTQYEKSLSKTCMNCHSNKKEFCDTCHNYSSVKPFCWGCHVEPKENI